MSREARTVVPVARDPATTIFLSAPTAPNIHVECTPLPLAQDPPAPLSVRLEPATRPSLLPLTRQQARRSATQRLDLAATIPPDWPLTSQAQAGGLFTIMRPVGYMYLMAPSARRAVPVKAFIDEIDPNRLPVIDTTIFRNRSHIQIHSSVVVLSGRRYMVVAYYDREAKVNSNLLSICPTIWRGELVLLSLGERKRLLKCPAGPNSYIARVINLFVNSCVKTLTKSNFQQWPELIIPSSNSLRG